MIWKDIALIISTLNPENERINKKLLLDKLSAYFSERNKTFLEYRFRFECDRRRFL